MSAPRMLRFVTRADCRLCAEAEPLVRRAASRFGLDVALHDVDADATLLGRYGERVPVVLDDRDRVLAEGRITRRDAVRAALRARFGV